MQRSSSVNMDDGKMMDSDNNSQAGNEGNPVVLLPAIDVKEREKTAVANSCLATNNNPDSSASDTSSGVSDAGHDLESDDIIKGGGGGGITEEEFVKYIFKTIVKSRRAMHVFKE